MADAAIGLVASLIAILELSVKTIGYIQTAKGATKERAQLTAEIQFCQILVGGLRDVSEHDGWQETMEVLVKPGAPLQLLQETLQHLAQKLTPTTGLRHKLHVLKWPFEEKEVKSILDMMERQKASLSLALDNNSRLLQDKIMSQIERNTTNLAELRYICGDIQEDIDALARDNEQLKASKTLQWITKLNFGSRHEALVELWEENTATWVLQHDIFKTWLQTPSQTIWCCGNPGVGKSVTAAMVSNFLDVTFESSSPRVSVVTLYCDHENQATQTLDELERSIFHQVLADCPAVPESIHELFRVTKDGFSPRLSDLHSAVNSASMSLETLFLVLDALDEASDIVQDEIMGRISKLPFTDVRILCTSRPSPKMEIALRGCPRIEIVATNSDIETFVRKQIKDNRRLLEIIGKDEKLQRKIVAQIISKADGMFLMARQHVESLFTTASKAELRRALESLPSKVKDAYRETMERVLRQPGNDMTRAKRTLSWVFGAKRQLTVIEVRYALATLSLCQGNETGFVEKVSEDELPQPNIIISCCQGLLVQENQIIRPCHQTAIDYFQQSYHEWFPNGQREMATACCHYLSQERLHKSIAHHLQRLTRQRQGTSSRTSEYEAWSADEKLLQRYPLLSYAGTYWGVHFWEAYGRTCLPAMMREHGNTIKRWMDLGLPGSLQLQRSIEVILGIQTGIRTLQKIVDQGCDVNATDADGRSLLCQAVERGDTDAITFLLSLQGLDVSCDGSRFDQMMHTAIELGNNDLLQVLLRMITVNGKQSRREKQDCILRRYSTEEFNQIQMKAIDICRDLDQLYPARTLRVCHGWDTPVRKPFYHTLSGQFLQAKKRLELTTAILTKAQLSDPQQGRSLALLLLSQFENNFMKADDMKIVVFLLETSTDPGTTVEDAKIILQLAKKGGYREIVEYVSARNYQEEEVA